MVSTWRSNVQSTPVEPYIQDTTVYLMKPKKLNLRVMTVGFMFRREFSWSISCIVETSDEIKDVV